MPVSTPVTGVLESLVRQAKALSDPTRLKILRLVAHEELCVQQLVDVLGVSQSAVSQHLGKLRAAGLVCERRQGQWVFYRTTGTASTALDASVARLFDTPLAALAELAAQYERLQQLDRTRCCRVDPGRGRSSP